MEALTHKLFAGMFFAFAGFSCTVEEDSSETDTTIDFETVASPSETATHTDNYELPGEPRTDAKLICLLLKNANQRAKEAFCRSPWRLDRFHKEACWATANSGSAQKWEIYCLATVFPG
ncbi:uncharacterized protein SOCEGT47_025870 [Sorangium cellulosum]|uniref:Uncharacterized protein n=1 Tax=Sorangium cellulosum TaxID=56 RepID=A0A4P2PZP7_SORCE|nr:uncharacterized protein SOCEGT47_025870 [Sorangium cellulosum]